MGYSGLSTSDSLAPRYPSPAPSDLPVCPPEFVITPPSKPFFPGPGPMDKLETIEEYKERLRKRLPKIEVLEAFEELQQRLWSTPVPPIQPEFDYIPGRDTFTMFRDSASSIMDTNALPVTVPLVRDTVPVPQNRYLPGMRGRLGENIAVLVLSVTDEEGKPVMSAVAVDYPNSTEHYEIGDAISIPLDPLKLGAATITVQPPEGWETPTPVKLTLNPGTQEVKVTLTKSRMGTYVAAAVVGTVALGGGPEGPRDREARDAYHRDDGNDRGGAQP